VGVVRFLDAAGVDAFFLVVDDDDDDDSDDVFFVAVVVGVTRFSK
jgi:hypothetical protein